ncbi:uncharacterized protein LOC111483279 isoform X1 [Cucurbita maxima]|uniref:Uncharacterized protein LOC111483279 isoform X1 n=1 Tax=Cucurbita maxima TaxID=3661 RepID=A0A6J1JAQ9_CUCMA|nr:uncharacterized protein LOC111483279 isoform X1 [Cucurbita maxima]XP_022985206.1 uncharacterized protein LOC111483279 isoform X1 [Cucurbita maxima]XP_022985207.1 uncharacterized protein LOC111483279 isoform X1 [Cucurbita maxima]XP_022985208.1 uncharacterized protein LOC111483279 isoform X1 [Cucurbita maxima]
MSQADQGISADNLVDAPLKRKRGRPRKYPKLSYDENILISKNRGKKHLEAIPISPGSGVNGNQSQPAIQIQNISDGMLGQVVSGVIEAVFEAGYLLCVRVGNSGITLRGVVFKPGHYVPVSAENDVAPDIQMIRRNMVPFATGNQSPGNNPLSNNGEVPSHESSGATLGFKYSPPHSNWDAPKEKSVSSILAQITPSGSSRGNVVPVVQLPAKLTNGPLGPSETFTLQTADIESSKGKEVLIGSFTSNESAPNDVTVGIESFSFQPQTSQQVVLQDNVSVENASHNKSLVMEVHDSEGKSMALPSTPFESLVTEVIKRIQAPTLSAEMQTENNKPTVTISAKEFEVSSEVEANLLADGALMIEPLKAVQPLHESSEHIPKALDDESRTGKMTELLQVLQENMMQTPDPWGDVHDPCLMLKSEEPGESRREIGDEEEAGNQKQM